MLREIMHCSAGKCFSANSKVLTKLPLCIHIEEREITSKECPYS